MAIRPTGAPLTFTNSASSIPVFASEVSREFVVLDFDRNEFSNNRLRSAKNLLGGLPIILNNIANIPVQVNYSCASDDARPLGPDDANIASIKQRFNIQKFNITSTPVPYIYADQLFSIAQTHKTLLDKFTLYQEESSQMDLSYDFLVALQAETFSYLTTTSLSMTGDCLGGTVANLLISEFRYDTDISVTNADGSKSLFRTFSMTVENRAVTSRTS